ncbi:MAG: hypothetical protein AAGF77_01745 [Bacteroidota bacterium]
MLPFVRGYWSLHQRLALFGQAEYRYFKTTLESIDEFPITGTRKNETNGYFVGVRPGVTYFISDVIALEATLGSLGYLNSKFENDQGREVNASSFDFSLNTDELFFGLTLYF